MLTAIRYIFHYSCGMHFQKPVCCLIELNKTNYDLLCFRTAGSPLVGILGKVQGGGKQTVS